MHRCGNRDFAVVITLFASLLNYIVYRFAGDVAELGIIRSGEHIKAKVILNPRVHLVRSESMPMEFI